MKNNTKKYSIKGYDKDNDFYQTLYESNYKNKIREVSKIMKSLLENGNLMSSLGEPFDWLLIASTEPFEEYVIGILCTINS